VLRGRLEKRSAAERLLGLICGYLEAGLMVNGG
jgi:tetrahydromethanopterin S-methyltransferase subunit F